MYTHQRWGRHASDITTFRSYREACIWRQAAKMSSLSGCVPGRSKMSGMHLRTTGRSGYYFEMISQRKLTSCKAWSIDNIRLIS